MIESSRRHGHFDTRWSLHGGREPRALAPAEADNGGASLERWDDDGGRYRHESVPEVDGSKRAPTGLDWGAFLRRYFPRPRRHDLGALKAYETYRSASVSTSTTGASSIGLVTLVDGSVVGGSTVPHTEACLH